MNAAEQEKNNHYVPRRYLKNFSSGSDRQIALYNIKSGKVVLSAPMKSQCSRDYFYTKDPRFEEYFTELEQSFISLTNNILRDKALPQLRTADRSNLSTGIMFQAGRTASSVVYADNLFNQVGKAMLSEYLKSESQVELAELLPDVTLGTVNGVMDSIQQHILMYPMIDDLDCNLLLNESSEDFLTSDHPVALCNSIPSKNKSDAALGFASRGLMIIYPLTPRALILMTDPEVYKVDNNGGVQRVRRKEDVISFNLAQFGNAHENVYFSDLSRVEQTLAAFRKKTGIVRPPLPLLSEAVLESVGDNRRRKLMVMPGAHRRLSLPRFIQIRYAVKTRRYKIGNSFVRDPIRAAVVESELDRVQKLREQATILAEKDRDYDK